MDTTKAPPCCEYDQNLDLLLKAEIFAKIPIERLRTYALLVKRMNYQAGDFVFHQGDYDNKAYLLVQGSLSITYTYVDKSIAHGTITEGRVFGTLALLADTERLFSVEALEPAMCLILPRPKALSQLDKDPEAAKIFLRIITDRLSHWEKNCLVEAATIESCPCKYGVSLI
ncbi:Crp/Fnr family transcriptional regulator [Halodesulfovibrio sp.]|jgi:CRP-like cAMP-binding protein|uniref:Crp/Fnr family transcriptional regulator n=1 Tax=Halodesulfovibrio sp. TaxID=1912772 RepID=UPI0025F1C86F|nr:cyclic nucleotide-binding domain-containing protein [Halodesulfovibrio sp.]MCT4535387.1 cyclic nucleotide-binding domain-containing protein [Halodesulfovibrio sp.]MCT4626200.1 cyclic nucleotide-binding domain-containing protein [Halodesulfovibrio sp.]